jgi:peptidoglycan/LPS O-acetylase OafA/YrhL
VVVGRPACLPRVPALDGVRAIAILLVLFQHIAFPKLIGGRIGVDLFFTLSGYLITTLLLREHSKTGTISIRRFYMRRILRLIPALVSVVAFVLVYTWIVQPDRFDLAPGEPNEINDLARPR